MNKCLCHCHFFTGLDKHTSLLSYINIYGKAPGIYTSGAPFSIEGLPLYLNIRLAWKWQTLTNNNYYYCIVGQLISMCGEMFLKKFIVNPCNQLCLYESFVFSFIHQWNSTYLSKTKVSLQRAALKRQTKSFIKH